MRFLKPTNFNGICIDFPGQYAIHSGSGLGPGVLWLMVLWDFPRSASVSLIKTVPIPKWCFGYPSWWTLPVWAEDTREAICRQLYTLPHVAHNPTAQGEFWGNSRLPTVDSFRRYVYLNMKKDDFIYHADDEGLCCEWLCRKFYFTEWPRDLGCHFGFPNSVPLGLAWLFGNIY